MNIKKTIKLNFIMSLILFAALFAVSIYFNYSLNKNVPDLLEYKKLNSTGITFEKLEEVKEQYKELMFTGYCVSSPVIKNKYDILPSKDIVPKVILTDENYFQLYPYNFVEGGKLDHLSVQNGNKVAVISDTLATELYKSTRILGSIIYINDDKYKIVGVYKASKAFTFRISGYGYEDVFIPYSAYTVSNKNEGLMLDGFATKETEQNSSKKIYNKLLESLGSGLSLYYSENLTNSKKISFQYIRIFLFLVGSYVILLLIRLLIKCVKKLGAIFSQGLKTSYFIDVIKEKRKGILGVSLKALLCLTGIIIIFILIKFNFLIKNNYLPSDNIFDLKFYKEAIVSNMQFTNIHESSFGNVYSRYMEQISGIEKITLFGEVVAFIFLIINGNALITL